MPKKVVVLVCMMFMFAFTTMAWADTYVNGYFRSDGTYVQPHFRSDPDGNFYNNYSTYPNINPYTGKQGTKRYPDYNYGSGYSGYTVPDYSSDYKSNSTRDYSSSYDYNSGSSSSSEYFTDESNAEDWTPGEDEDLNTSDTSDTYSSPFSSSSRIDIPATTTDPNTNDSQSDWTGWIIPGLIIIGLGYRWIKYWAEKEPSVEKEEEKPSPKALLTDESLNESDYAINGAIKIANGASKFSQWYKLMLDDFGILVQPRLREIYAESRKIYSMYSNGDLNTARMIEDYLKKINPTRA